MGENKKSGKEKRGGRRQKKIGRLRQPKKDPIFPHFFKKIGKPIGIFSDFPKNTHDHWKLGRCFGAWGLAIPPLVLLWFPWHERWGEPAMLYILEQFFFKKIRLQKHRMGGNGGTHWGWLVMPLVVSAEASNSFSSPEISCQALKSLVYNVSENWRK